MRVSYGYDFKLKDLYADRLITTGSEIAAEIKYSSLMAAGLIDFETKTLTIDTNNTSETSYGNSKNFSLKGYDLISGKDCCSITLMDEYDNLTTVPIYGNFKMLRIQGTLYLEAE